MGALLFVFLAKSNPNTAAKSPSHAYLSIKIYRPELRLVGTTVILSFFFTLLQNYRRFFALGDRQLQSVEFEINKSLFGVMKTRSRVCAVNLATRFKRASGIKIPRSCHVHAVVRFPCRKRSGDDEFQEFYVQYKGMIESYFFGGRDFNRIKGRAGYERMPDALTSSPITRL